MFDLTGKNIAVTGGYGHLGRAIALGLVSHGATVHVLGRDGRKFEEAFSGEDVLFTRCDVSDSGSVREAFESIGRVDVLINNAFYSRGNSPEAMTDDDWTFTMDGALGSVYRCIREVIPFFKRQGGGKIVNVSSMYGMVAPQFEVYDGFPQFLNPPHYGAAKAGVIQLTRYFASLLGRDNITVNCVTPGAFPSDEVRKNRKFIESLEERTCLGRIGKPEDLAGAFVYLSSAASDYMTGQNMVIDGGWTAV